MAIAILDENISFPEASKARRDGLLAVGGDLSAERLLSAYQNGIFPWFSEGSPILWWSPDPRMVLFPSGFKKSKSLSQSIRNANYEIRLDEDFSSVIRNCAEKRKSHEEGTWITEEMITAYNELHKAGYAHSAETYRHGKLAGGLYGVSLGRAFFGESMFYLERDASKVALSALVDRLLEWEFHFIDAQQQTAHLQRMGARPVSRTLFLKMLEEALKFPTIKGKW